MHTGSVNGQNINIDVNVSDGDIIRIGQQLCAVAKVEVNYNNVHSYGSNAIIFSPRI